MADGDKVAQLIEFQQEEFKSAQKYQFDLRSSG